MKNVCQSFFITSTGMPGQFHFCVNFATICFSSTELWKKIDDISRKVETVLDDLQFASTFRLNLTYATAGFTFLDFVTD